MKLIRTCIVTIMTLGVMSLGTAAWAAPLAPEILSPHNGEEVLTGPVTAVGVSDPGTLVHVYEGDVEVGLGVCEDGFFEANLNLTDGSHTIRARAFNIETGWSPYSASVTFTIDLPPAKPTFTKPAQNSSTNNPSVLLEGTAENGTTVTLSEGGTEIAADLPVVGGKWSATRTFSEAKHIVTAVATDARGRDSQAESRTFTVDLTAPGAPSITAPASNAYLNSRNVTVSGTAEAGSTVSILEGATVRATATANASGAWSRTIGSVTEGAHTYKARAKDAAGNTGPDSAGVTFTVDVTVPTVTITTANNAVFVLDDLGEIEGTAGDGLSGVASVELHYELYTGADRGTRNATCAGCPGASVTWSDVPAMMPGYYTVTATAIDRAGNRSEPVSIEFFQANP